MRSKLYNDNLLIEAQTHIDRLHLNIAWERFCEFYKKAGAIRKNDEYLLGLFGACLGYLPDEGMKFMDYGAHIIDEGRVIGIIEILNEANPDKNLVIPRAFARLGEHEEARYLIITDKKILRFYLDYEAQWQSSYFEDLDFLEFCKFYALLNYNALKSGIPVTMRERTAYREQDISSKLYRNFKIFRMSLFEDMCIQNESLNHLLLSEALNKLCDRIIFAIYASHNELLPSGALESVQTYDELKSLFALIHTGDDERGVVRFNGDLFAPDLLLDNLKISDLALELNLISKYDYKLDVTPDMLSYILSQIYNFEEIFQKN
ncbi:hypothetical protein [Campylobacter sp. VBCF_08 NA3]|uniref:hypothetical protein n=1 Tax=Campylobacter sp. VBCF_08 NA3 TaxID=2983833 RepID=UPI0022E9A81B|nr:hypothetical protein [Campylobacter sp. VBCF_08 NA3]MDA3069689.1 hypothetical protein [Campylobacter sp. VBCF_08 NA3]